MPSGLAVAVRALEAGAGGALAAAAARDHRLVRADAFAAKQLAELVGALERATRGRLVRRAAIVDPPLCSWRRRTAKAAGASGRMRLDTTPRSSSGR